MIPDTITFILQNGGKTSILQPEEVVSLSQRLERNYQKLLGFILDGHEVVTAERLELLGRVVQIYRPENFEAYQRLQTKKEEPIDNEEARNSYFRRLKQFVEELDIIVPDFGQQNLPVRVRGPLLDQLLTTYVPDTRGEKLLEAEVNKAYLRSYQNLLWAYKRGDKEQFLNFCIYSTDPEVNVRNTTALERKSIEKVAGHLAETDLYKDQTIPQQIRKSLREIKQDKDRLIKANLRLCSAIARRYRNRGIDYPDLVQSGSIGLMRAVDKFDHRRGFKFSTYAGTWISQAILREIEEHGRTIRIPGGEQDLINRVYRVRNKLRDDLSGEREPTEEEIAAETKLAVGDVRRILIESRRTTSLQLQTVEDGPTTLEDLIVDPDAHETIETAAESSELRGVMDQELGKLPPRERAVLIYRYRDGLTLDETGERVKRIDGSGTLTRERARQLETRALRRINNQNRRNAPLRQIWEQS
ncbi:hypothetical protein COV20_02640 [Candidatus Woesearchaeota archaeon CG10_big_fil_rev_8_21_14_0_10_45_16]|nr:MAG: hypothetical protein COV20_02640 [Candidatus Woesearchaeota archaeon CG10_big_fil_rev_8_21_14_0_10_45_16]